MAILRPNPFFSYNFLVSINSIAVAAFQECGGLETTTQPVDYREGDGPQHMQKLAGMNSYSPITLKRGMTDSLELWNWRLDVMKGSFERRNGTILLRDREGKTLRQWHFHEAWPSKWIGPAFNASSNAIAIETLELTHEEITPEAFTAP